MNYGDFPIEETIHVFFTTRAFATGIPGTLSAATVAVYEDITATPIETSIAVTESLNSIAGLNAVPIVAIAASGYEVGKNYHVVIEAGTVDSVSVVGEVVAYFSIGRSAAAVDLANGTDGLGAIKTETAAILVGTVTNAQGADVATDVAAMIDGNNRVDVGSFLGTAVAAATASGEVAANVTEWLGTGVGAATAGTPNVNVEEINNSIPAVHTLRDWMGEGIRLTADSGTTTTLVDAGLTQADDYWNGSLLVFRTGTNSGYTAIVTDFDAASDTITFTPAVPDAVTTEGFALIPGLGHTAAITDAVWDEILTGASHNIATSAGRRLRQLEQAFTLASGTVAAISGHTVTLDAGAVGTADYYIGARLQITEGNGAGQSRIIVGYTSLKVATLDSNFVTDPNTASLYEVVAADVHVSVSDSDLAEGFVAVATSTTTITLDAAAVATTDYYVGELIVFTHGTGVGQAREITAYTSGRVVTMSPALVTALDTTTVWHIQAVVSVPEIVDEVWNEDATGHQTTGTFGQAIGDPGANTETMYDAVVTDAAGTNIAADIIVIEGQTDDIGVAGAGLTAINLPNQTMDITGNLSGSVGSVTGAVGSVAGNVDGNVTGSIGSLAAQAKTDVNAEVVDVMDTDTITLPGQTAPPLAPTHRQAISWLYKVFRNRKTQTATQWSLLADDESTVDAKATVSDDATTAIKQEVVTGP